MKEKQGTPPDSPSSNHGNPFLTRTILIETDEQMVVLLKYADVEVIHCSP